MKPNMNSSLCGSSRCLCLRAFVPLHAKTHVVIDGYNRYITLVEQTRIKSRSETRLAKIMEASEKGLQALTYMVKLSVKDNHLTGSFPAESVRNTTTLAQLDIQGNSISGVFPSMALEKLSALVVLRI
eukprot:2051159-Amphidinium_carterae.1